MSLIGETFDGQWYPGYDDYFITRWGPDEQDPLKAAYVGNPRQRRLHERRRLPVRAARDDEVLWVI